MSNVEGKLCGNQRTFCKEPWIRSSPGRGGILIISEILTRIRFLILRKNRGELDEELESHLEQAIASRMANGVSATEARRQALVEFGGIELPGTNASGSVPAGGSARCCRTFVMRCAGFAAIHFLR